MSEEAKEKLAILLAYNAMTTLETIKLMLNIEADDTSYDEILTLLINYVSAWIETQTGRSFGLKDYREQVKGQGEQEILTKNYPVRKVEKITDDNSGQLVSPLSYSFNETGYKGVIFKDSTWARKAYPQGLVPDYIVSKRYLTVDYTAGYVLPKDVTEDTDPEWILPADLQGLIWQMVGHELSIQENESDGLSAFSISDVSWTFDKTPREIWGSTIDRYRRL